MTRQIDLKTMSPVLVVPSIAPCLAFYAKLGFTVTVTVPDEEPFGFAILQREGLELMLQTRASVLGDIPAVAEAVAASILYIGVDALEPVMAAVADAPVAVARRRTFYGADEIFVLDPAGNIVGFAATAPATGQDSGAFSEEGLC
jgi:catechol 2,3-dioxygenase-like lactoylglutathione lyase family enzyme